MVYIHYADVSVHILLMMWVETGIHKANRYRRTNNKSAMHIMN